jgi:hypothetical protein
MTEILDDLVSRLAQARIVEAEAKATMKELLDAAKAQDVYCQAGLYEKRAIDDVLSITEAIRKEAIDIFYIDGPKDKHPHEAVEIKMVNTVKIVDPALVKEWCIHNFTPALKLDEKMVEKQAIAGNIPNALVNVTPEAKAFIASDLSKFLNDPD